MRAHVLIAALVSISLMPLIFTFAWLFFRRVQVVFTRTDEAEAEGVGAGVGAASFRLCRLLSPAVSPSTVDIRFGLLSCPWIDGSSRRMAS